MTSKDFESKLEGAKALLEKLMDPEITLGESMELYKNGMQALSQAQEILEKAKIEYEEIKGEATKSKGESE